MAARASVKRDGIGLRSRAETRVGLVLALVVVSYVLSPAGVARAAWNIEQVEPSKYIARDPGGSFRIDPSGRSAVAYGDDWVFYAVQERSAWTIETVSPSGCAGQPTLAFDAAGDAAIAYVLYADLVLGRRIGGTWVAETVDSAPGSASPSLGFDGAGNAAIGYCAPGGSGQELKLARWDGTSWQIEVLDSGSRCYPSLSSDGSGSLAIAYSNGTDLKLARRTGTSWQIEVVDSAAADVAFTAVSLGFDHAGTPALAYAQTSTVQGAPLDFKVARWMGASWRTDVVDSSHQDSDADDQLSLAFDLTGNPAISYFVELGGLRLARWSGTSFEIDVVEATSLVGRGRCYGLAFDGTGNPAIGYVRYDGDNGSGLEKIKVAHRDGTGFAIDVVEGGSMVGAYPSLAMDGSSRPAMSYVADGYDPGLRFARQDGTSWRVESVDPAGRVGTSLAFDTAGDPAISYLADGGLKLARWTGADWQPVVVDGAARPAGWASSKWTSLAFDHRGNPAISYHAFANGAGLRLARWNGTSWEIDVVDRVSALFATSLAFDRVGNPAIAYSDEDQVKLARWDGTRWAIEVIDSVVSRSWSNTSLAFDPSGDPALSYAQQGGIIVLARRQGIGWQIETFYGGHIACDDHGFACTVPSLIFDRDGNPAIGYDYRVARRNEMGWQVEVVDTGAANATSYGNSLALDRAGNLAFGYVSQWNCGAGPRYASLAPLAGALYRGTVACVAPGWKSAALPLTSLNQDPTPPFPIPSSVPGTAEDTISGSQALVLYRLLGPGDTDTGNLLRAVKRSTAVALSF